MKQDPEYSKQYYQLNKERIKERTRVYAITHKEQCCKKTKEWAKKNPDKIKISQKRYEERNIEKIRARRKRYYTANREKILQRARPSSRLVNLKLKTEVLSFYGKGECKCCVCGMDNLDCLSLDHLNNNGYEHRKVLRSNSIYKFVRKNGFPEGYQTLCMNCQWIKKAEHIRFKRRLPSRF